MLKDLEVGVSNNPFSLRSHHCYRVTFIDKRQQEHIAEVTYIARTENILQKIPYNLDKYIVYLL